MKANYYDRVRPSKHFGKLNYRSIGIPAYVDPLVSASGTAVPLVDEADVVTGGETIILTLSNGVWPNPLTDDMKNALVAQFTSPRDGGTEWNDDVRDVMDEGDVARTDDVTVTITLPAAASYDIDANEPVTFFIENAAEAFNGGSVGGRLFAPILTVEDDGE